MNQLLYQYPWYAPSPGTLYKWLYTRKRPLKGTNFQSPGLLETTGFGTDAFLFTMAVLLEIIGLVIFYVFFESILFAALFFVLDFLFAICAHWNVGRWTELKNQLALIRDFEFGEAKDTGRGGNLKPIAARIQWRKRTINRFKVYAVIFDTLIGLIAAFKVAGFFNGWFEGGNEFGVIPILIAVTYALVAFIHIYATGFFFAEIYVRFLTVREANDHQFTRNYSVDQLNPYAVANIQLRNGLEFTCPDPSNQLPFIMPRTHIQCNNHWLKYNTLFTFGVLTDVQIRQIRQNINDPNGAILNEKRDTFLKHALFHQLTAVLSNNPVQNTEPPPAVPSPPPAPVFPLPAGQVLMNDDETYPWFTPSLETKKAWMFTRKENYQAGTFQAPGFFTTANFQTDTFLFSLAVVLEVVGLVAFYAFFGNILFAGLFFLLDFIFAIGSHWNKGRLTTLKNQLALINPPCSPSFNFSEPGDNSSTGSIPPDPVRMAWRINTIRRFTLTSGFFYFLICLIAAFKAYGFIDGWFQAGQTFGVIPLMIAITYALVAFIHIYATGYFFAEIYYRFRLKREKRAHMLTHAYTVPDCPLYLTTTVVMPPGVASNQIISHGGHYFIKNTLYTFGLITDQQINNISLALATPYERECFLKYGLHHQITSVMGLAPVSGSPTLLEHIQPPPPLLPVNRNVPLDREHEGDLPGFDLPVQTANL